MARTTALGSLRAAVAALGVAASVAGAQSAPRAVADGIQYDGALAGAADVAVFKGIPFAQPPVGPLRWRPPEPIKPASGNRPALKFSPHCVQTNRLAVWTRTIAAAFGTEAKVVDDPFEVSEDCLYLNVWTAAEPRSLAPVMVWIHGGSNLNGSGASSWYDGTELARRGAVVVTINYRLGIFGFMGDSALAAESPHGAAGNYGLMDQLEALRWVQRNIRGFGGDPNRVTVFGESAGSIDLMHLVASPLSKGLFHRAIAESGAPFAGMPNLAATHRAASFLAKQLGADTAANRLAALRAAPADKVLAAQNALVGTGFLPGPSVDGWVLPDVTARIFERGEHQRIPVMIGSNALEMSTLRTYVPAFQRTVAGYGAWTRAMFGANAERVQALFPASADSLVDRATLGLVTDFLFTCPARLAARAMNKAGQNVYLYHFTRVAPGGEKLGAWHAAEISYVFGMVPPWLPQDRTDAALGEEIRGYWLRFAATGDPNGTKAISWPAYGTRGRDYYLELGDAIVTRTDLAKDRCDTIEPTNRALYQASPNR
ncbi:MAG: carboxylesterase family protein [Gemmatimonadales bacterium]|nr:carboxylesterase family protein [Gemmatimonadales bacterium]